MNIGMSANDDIQNLLMLADTYRSNFNHTLNTVSLRAAKQGAYLAKLRAGTVGITLTRRDAIMQWFSDHWPDDLAWPDDIPRPSRAGREAA